MKCPFCNNELYFEKIDLGNNETGVIVKCKNDTCFLYEGQGFCNDKNTVLEMWNKNLTIKNTCPICKQETVLVKSEDYEDCYEIGCKTHNCLLNIDNPWFYNSETEIISKLKV